MIFKRLSFLFITISAFSVSIYGAEQQYYDRAYKNFVIINDGLPTRGTTCQNMSVHHALQSKCAPILISKNSWYYYLSQCPKVEPVLNQVEVFEVNDQTCLIVPTTLYQNETERQAQQHKIGMALDFTKIPNSAMIVSRNIFAYFFSHTVPSWGSACAQVIKNLFYKKNMTEPATQSQAMVNALKTVVAKIPTEAVENCQTYWNIYMTNQAQQSSLATEKHCGFDTSDFQEVVQHINRNVLMNAMICDGVNTCSHDLNRLFGITPLKFSVACCCSRTGLQTTHITDFTQMFEPLSDSTLLWDQMCSKALAPYLPQEGQVSSCDKIPHIKAVSEDSFKILVPESGIIKVCTQENCHAPIYVDKNTKILLLKAPFINELILEKGARPAIISLLPEGTAHVIQKMTAYDQTFDDLLVDRFSPAHVQQAPRVSYLIDALTLCNGQDIATFDSVCIENSMMDEETIRTFKKQYGPSIGQQHAHNGTMVKRMGCHYGADNDEACVLQEALPEYKRKKLPYAWHIIKNCFASLAFGASPLVCASLLGTSSPLGQALTIGSAATAVSAIALNAAWAHSMRHQFYQETDSWLIDRKCDATVSSAYLDRYNSLKLQRRALLADA